MSKPRYYLKNLATGQIVNSSPSLAYIRRLRNAQPAGSHVLLDANMVPGR